MTCNFCVVCNVCSLNISSIYNKYVQSFKPINCKWLVSGSKPQSRVVVNERRHEPEAADKYRLVHLPCHG